MRRDNENVTFGGSLEQHYDINIYPIRASCTVACIRIVIHASRDYLPDNVRRTTTRQTVSIYKYQNLDYDFELETL